MTFAADMLTAFAFVMVLVMLACNLAYFKLLVSPFRTRHPLVQGRLRQWLLLMVVYHVAAVLGWLADPVLFAPLR